MRNFKDVLKKIGLTASSTYDEELNRLKDLPEFSEVEVEKDRREVFEAFMERVRRTHDDGEEGELVEHENRSSTRHTQPTSVSSERPSKRRTLVE